MAVPHLVQLRRYGPVITPKTLVHTYLNTTRPEVTTTRQRTERLGNGARPLSMESDCSSKATLLFMVLVSEINLPSVGFVVPRHHKEFNSLSSTIWRIAKKLILPGVYFHRQLIAINYSPLTDSHCIPKVNTNTRSSSSKRLSFRLRHLLFLSLLKLYLSIFTKGNRLAASRIRLQ